MRLPHPVICKTCHQKMTSYIDEICDDCFIKDQNKDDLFCPCCNIKLNKDVLYMANRRFAYYICKNCGYVLLNKNTIERISSIREIKEIINLP